MRMRVPHALPPSCFVSCSGLFAVFGRRQVRQQQKRLCIVLTPAVTIQWHLHQFRQTDLTACQTNVQRNDQTNDQTGRSSCLEEKKTDDRQTGRPIDQQNTV